VDGPAAADVSPRAPTLWCNYLLCKTLWWVPWRGSLDGMQGVRRAGLRSYKSRVAETGVAQGAWIEVDMRAGVSGRLTTGGPKVNALVKQLTLFRPSRCRPRPPVGRKNCQSPAQAGVVGAGGVEPPSSSVSDPTAGWSRLDIRGRHLRGTTGAAGGGSRRSPGCRARRVRRDPARR
jgi:hypothetical protein